MALVAIMKVWWRRLCEWVMRAATKCPRWQSHIEQILGDQWCGGMPARNIRSSKDGPNWLQENCNAATASRSRGLVRAVAMPRQRQHRRGVFPEGRTWERIPVPTGRQEDAGHTADTLTSLTSLSGHTSAYRHVHKHEGTRQHTRHTTQRDV
jgi:hypothetical protein